jgi:hypothetical protein
MRFFRPPFGLFALVLALGACSDLASERDVRVTILDERGEPLPGAVFWAVSSDDSGTIGWLLDVAGHAGEVPDSAREPLKIAWRPGARLVLGALSPGRRPARLGGGPDRVRSDGAVLVLEPLAPGEAPGPLDGLGIPLPDAPEALSALRADPAWPALAEALRAALAAREAAVEALTPGERRMARVLASSPAGKPLQGLDTGTDN